ncbi:MAG: hypothetical protein JNK05_19280 [Myxococcales bacterium]|nr:hypothetical protein [Myxococcales bacterium]
MTHVARITRARLALDEAHRAAGLARKPIERSPRDTLVSTGVSLLDDALGGGLSRGALYALSGEAGSGRASLALSWLLRATLLSREPVAFVDGADALDPESVPEVLRPRMLWVRARSGLEATACAEQVLDAGGFAMVCVYLVGASGALASRSAREEHGRPARQIGPGHWARIVQRAESGRAIALAVVDRDDPRAPGPLARASFVATRGAPRWGRSDVLDAATIELGLARNRQANAHNDGYARASLAIDVW